MMLVLKSYFQVKVFILFLLPLVSDNFVTTVTSVMIKVPKNSSKPVSPSTSKNRKETTSELCHIKPCKIPEGQPRHVLPNAGGEGEYYDDVASELSLAENSVVDDGGGEEVTYDEQEADIFENITPETTTLNSTLPQEWKASPRLIAVKVNAAPPRRTNGTNGAQSLYNRYPTIRLADFARKIMFPEWIWTRLTPPPIIKKSEGTDTVGPEIRPGDSGDKLFPATTTRRPKGILERPTITFDNNMSRFLRLFTVVRFQNVPCIGPNGENGTCYHGKECSDMGGHGTSSCAQGLGVCCLFFKTCGETVTRNGTYFVSTGATFTRGVSTCNINIQKLNPSIRQLRLDFHSFVMLPPNAGNCEADRFLVSGQNTNNIVPILCGNNSGTHLYVETGTSQSLIQLSVMTTGEGLRAWSIQVNQIEENQSLQGAPSHCLQYFEGAMGTITSFNYESTLSPQYLNNMNYVICIRKEAGFCSVSYSNIVPDGQYYPFQIVNADPQGNLLLPSGQAGVGIRNCPDDYLLISGVRLCGERLNDGTKSSLMMDDAPISDITNGPFTVTVRTNEIDVGGGFSVYYRQNPCMSTAG